MYIQPGGSPYHTVVPADNTLEGWSLGKLSVCQKIKYFLKCKRLIFIFYNLLSELILKKVSVRNTETKYNNKI